MRAICLAPMKVWGQGEGAALGSPQDRRHAKCIVAVRLPLLRQSSFTPLLSWSHVRCTPRIVLVRGRSSSKQNNGELARFAVWCGVSNELGGISPRSCRGRAGIGLSVASAAFERCADGTLPWAPASRAPCSGPHRRGLRILSETPAHEPPLHRGETHHRLAGRALLHHALTV